MSAKTQRLQGDLKKLKRDTDVTVMGLRAEVARYKQEGKNGTDNAHHYREAWQASEENRKIFESEAFDRNTELLIKLGDERRRREKIQQAARFLAEELSIAKDALEEAEGELGISELLLDHALSSLEEE